MNSGISKYKSKLEIIEYNSLPVAARFSTTDTSITSNFFPLNIISFIKRGSLKVFTNQGAFYAVTGDCIFSSKFIPYRTEKKLDPISGDFESIILFLDYATSKNTILESNLNSLREGKSLCQICNSATKLTFNYLERQFDIKKSITPPNMERLTSWINLIIESIKSDDRNSIFNPSDDDFLSFLYSNFNLNITLEELASKYGLSTSSFYRLFINRLGISPHRWIKDQRLHYARLWMLFSQKTVSEIYLELGFEDMSHFSREFKKKFSYSPSKTVKLINVEMIN